MTMHARQHMHREFPSRVTFHGIHRCPAPRSHFPAFVCGMILGAIIATVGLARIMTHPAQGNPAVDEARPAVEFRASDLPLPTPDPAPTGKLA